MRKYTYRFADGRSKQIVVDDDWFRILKDSNYMGNEGVNKYHKWHNPLWLFEYRGICECSGIKGRPYEYLIYISEREDIDAALRSLTKKQSELVNRFYFQRKSIEELAWEYDVDSCIVEKRLERIKAKIRKVLLVSNNT